MATARKKDAEPELGTFEGRDVSAVKIVITKTGDGLSAGDGGRADHPASGRRRVHRALFRRAEDPFRRRQGRRRPDEPRIQILEATGATFVDRDLIGDAVEVMQERIEAHAEQLKIERDEAKGIFRLHAEDDDED